MFTDGTGGGSHDTGDVRGGRHSPVMIDEVVSFIAGEGRDGLVVDGTAGMGGHLSALLDKMPDARFLAVDRDPEAAAVLAERFGKIDRVTVRRASYSRIPEIIEELELGPAAAALFDLGLSSAQLDSPERGFAHSMEGPLDMRFDTTGGVTAADLLNRLPEKELADLIFRYGQERRSRRIAAFIVRSRPLETTADLVRAVVAAVGGRRVKVLSRVFQAVRIAVNGEMDELDRLLENLHRWTGSGAGLAFLTFHSVEDRKIKLLFRDDPSFREYSPKWLVPRREETLSNPRARSARLRMGIRL